MSTEEILKNLNTILQGEHMAIDIYHTYINNLNDSKLKEHLQEFQQDHKLHAIKLASRIQDLGGSPDESRGMAGFFAKTGAKLDTLTDVNPMDLLRKLYDGEDQGIARTEQIMRGVLDDSSLEIVEDIISEDHDHLKKMEKLLAEYHKDLH